MAVYPSKDTFLYDGAPDYAHGWVTTLRVGPYGGASQVMYRTAFHFDCSTLNAANSHVLALYVANVWGTCSAKTYRISRMTQTGWTEAGATWNKYDGTTAWASAGGDYTDTGAVDFNGVDSAGQWIEIDISTLVVDAINNRSNALHILIRDTSETGSTLMELRSTRYSGTTYDPYINVYVSKALTDSVASVTETIAVTTAEFDYYIASNNQAYVLNKKILEHDSQHGWSFCDDAPFVKAIYRVADRQIIGVRRDKGTIARINYGDTFDGSDINAQFQTGYMNLSLLDEVKELVKEHDLSEAVKKLRAYFVDVKGEGDLTLTIYSNQDDTTGEEFTIDLATTDNTTLNAVRVALSRDIRGKYVSFKVANVSGDDFWVGEQRVKIIPRQLK